MSESFAPLEFGFAGTACGWGPPHGSIPESKANIAAVYSPFDKSKLIGRAVDVTGRRRYYNRGGDEEAAAASQFGYQVDKVAESSFAMVDTMSAVRKPAWARRRRRFMPRGNRRGQQTEDEKKDRRHGAKSRFNRRRNQAWERRQQGFRRRRYGDKVMREPSVKVAATWEHIQQMQLPDLTKMRAPIPVVEDVVMCGKLGFYDHDYDKIDVRRNKVLKQHTKRFYTETTTDDPIIARLAQTRAGNIFATDVILAHLMASPRSVYPWDIVIERKDTKTGKFLFFDKREEQLEFLTVSETAYEPPAADDPDSINHPDLLAKEATYIQQMFTQQILKSPENAPLKEFRIPNPFVDEDDEEEDVALTAYRYRKFKLAEGNTLVVRCELHGVMHSKEQQEVIKKAEAKNKRLIAKGKKPKKIEIPEGSTYMTAFALNEWQPTSLSSGWRHKLDSQRGAVLAAELKDNSCKLAKWTAQTLLAGADAMKLGYVSRMSPYDRKKHLVLGTQFYKPHEFARQINLSETNMWGIFDHLTKILLAQPAGKFVLTKDPNKQILQLYRVPDDTFEQEGSDSDSSSDSGSDSGSGSGSDSDDDGEGAAASK